jgi:hypothetical protein
MRRDAHLDRIIGIDSANFSPNHPTKGITMNWAKYICGVAVFSSIAAQSVCATTLTFERFTPRNDHFPVENGYAGLDWFNFQVLNAQNQNFREGYRAGMVSPYNVIFNAYGDPAEITCPKLFDFDSAYMTAAVIDGLKVTISGYAGGEQLYTKTVTLSMSDPTLVRLDFKAVDRVHFFSTPGSQFAIDNMEVTVPDAPPTGDPVVTPPIQVSPIHLGPIEVPSIGRFARATPMPPPPGSATTAPPNFYLVDQNGYSGGGATLPAVDANWDTNMAFEVTLAAPKNKKFVVTVSSGGSAHFGGTMLWETGNMGGLSPSGPIAVQFEGLKGKAPDFTQSDAVLSDSQGFFGAFDMESSAFTKTISFTAMKIRGTVSPQVTGLGMRTYFPHGYNCLVIAGEGINVELAALEASDLVASAVDPTVAARPGADGSLILSFNGTLQSAPSPEGPYEDVAGNPQGSYITAGGSVRYFRVRN